MTLLPPILSLFFLSISNGFLMTLLPLRLSMFHYSLATIGYISAAYYVGLCLGALFNNTLLNRVGHIRAYATFVAILSASAIAQAIWVNPYYWFLLRVVCGWGIAGAFLVVESWLLASSHAVNRGRILAIYMIACFASMAFGQLFIGVLDTSPSGPTQSLPYVMASLVTSLCVIPVTLIPRQGPKFDGAKAMPPWTMFRLSPTGTVGSLATGILMGAVFTLFPVYLGSIHGEHASSLIGRLMFTSIIGGMVLQYPVGYWSDKSDRQWVMLIISAILCCLSLIVPTIYRNTWIIALILFLLGGGIFSLYPIMISHAADRVSSEHLVGMNQGLILTNALGSAIASPLLTPVMRTAGPNGLFVGICILLGLMFVFFVWRRSCRPAPRPETAFTAFPINSAAGGQYVQEAHELYEKPESDISS